MQSVGFPMWYLFGNHIAGFPTRRLIYKSIGHTCIPELCSSHDRGICRLKLVGSAAKSCYSASIFMSGCYQVANFADHVFEREPHYNFQKVFKSIYFKRNLVFTLRDKI